VSISFVSMRGDAAVYCQRSFLDRNVDRNDDNDGDGDPPFASAHDANPAPRPTSGDDNGGDVAFDAPDEHLRETLVAMQACVYGAEGSQSAQYAHVVDYFRYDASEERRTAGADMPHRRPHETAFARALSACDDSFVRARLFAEICDKRQLELRPSVSASTTSMAALLTSNESRAREALANSLQCERDVWLLLEW
jgi:hypothetical protein